VAATRVEHVASADRGGRALNSPSRSFLFSGRARFPPYFLKYIQALNTSRTMVTIQSDESLIPDFLAMTDILTSNRTLAMG